MYDNVIVTHPDAEQTRRALLEIRPDLVDGFDEHLPAARAAILSRLWTALRREPIPGVADTRSVGGDALVTLADGRMAIGPALGQYAEADPDVRIRVQVNGGTTAYADPAELLNAMNPETVHLQRELSNSVANLALARTAQTGLDLAELQGDPRGLAVMEQAVVDGHPLHPCCRTRLGMSTADVLAYAPEHRTPVELQIWSVPPSRWLTTGAGAPPRLVLHPWQAAHYGDELRRLGGKPVDRVTGQPLMSLRTLAVAKDRHYKTALGVQMTSAVRQVSPAAVHNGPRVSDLLIRLAADLPIRVLPEVAAGAVLVDGAPHPMLAYSVRRAPLPQAGDVWTPLAAVARPDVLDQILRIGYGGHPVAFWRDLTTVLIPPVLTLLARGAGLEAHGQNLLIRLAYGRPAEAGYRDVGGIHLHPGRLRQAGVDLPDVRGSLPTDDLDELRAKPFATLFAVVLTQIADRLEHGHGADPQALWRMAADLAEQAPDPRDRLALAGTTLPIKATTAMRLAADPVADIWATTTNPLAGV
ncbi:MAG: IucA/IucC family siderophore biosynthesis protein [Hamadaea sp.]|nr:IucA/IucC family siderophore biosynthesis protein [Hamadaea sp.]